ncbi:TetR/AcrR family transcriptional regulator [Micromonospora sp. NPDC093244]|jgi:AcrR family transcriptional regulator|uniref:TetR/AcrR family transcriptional regulator n=1 Tax=unclassified Micromonospora TaxID=2617518 RepID=UPI0034287DC0
MPTATWERLPESRRAAVLAAAEAEFAEHGFSAGSLNVVARNAGVSKGSLFQYFHDKVDLYAYLSELASQRIRAAMEEQIPHLPWDKGFFAAVRELTRVWVAYFDDHPLDLAFTAAVNLEPEGTARAAVRAVANRHYVEVLTPLLELGRERGELRADADLDAIQAWLLLLLPHLALAPHHPGLDPVLGLASSDLAERQASIERLLAPLEAAYGASGQTRPISTGPALAEAR